MGKKYLPYARHWVDENDIQAVAKVLQSDFITQGPTVKEFENKIASYVGISHAVAVSNGTAALEIAAKAANVGKGRLVITTPMSFVATSNAALLNGADVRFADIDKETFNIGIEGLEACVKACVKAANDPRQGKAGKSKPQAIIPVHFGGQCCEMDEINRIANENNLAVIEDACHALGAEYKGKKAGSLGKQGCFSFHPAKHITTSEGGMVTTNDEETYKKLLLLRDSGIDRTAKLVENVGYDVTELSRNYRISDVACALGLSQFGKLDHFIERRAEIAKMYSESFERIPGIAIPTVKNNRKHSWHLYCILAEKRNKLLKHLLASGILANVHYIPIYRHTLYKRRYNFSPASFPNTEYVFHRILTLPLFPKMSDEDVDKVIKAVKKGVAA